MKPMHVAFTMALTLGISLFARADAAPIEKGGGVPLPGAKDPGLFDPMQPGTPPPATKPEIKKRPGSNVPAKPVAPPTLEERVAALEAENAALRQIISVSGTAVTITSKGQLVLVSDGSLTAKAGGEIKLNAGTNLNLRAAATAEVKAGTAVALTAPTVKVNDKTLP